MRTITLFEHQTKAFHDLQLASDDPALSQIEQLNRSEKVELIRVSRRDLTARQYVGVLHIDELAFQILPKIDYAGNADGHIDSPQREQAIGSATQNLLHMLSYTHDLTLYQKRAASLRSQPANWFELLIRLFAEELHQQIKHGIDRTYVNVEERLSTIRGTWQIQRQITRPPYARHLFDVAYDEFMPDTTLNRVFKLVVDRLLRLSQDRDNKQLLRDISDWLIEVPLTPHITSKELARIQFTRLNSRFRIAFNLARLFLESLTPQLVVEKQRLFAFMFDMNILFERFVVSFLRRHHHQIFRAPFENLRVIAQSEGMAFYLAKRAPESRQVFRLKPDILLFTPDNTVVAIIDTKYKRLAPEQSRMGVAEADFYQALAYTTRLNCPRAMLLYPALRKGDSIASDFRVQGQETTIRATTIDLYQSLDQPANLIEQFRSSLTMFLRERIY